jgi:hypothetical protein
MKKIAKITAATIAAVLVSAALIADTKNITSTVTASIETCLYTVIPALFGFMMIASYLLTSGLYRIIFKPFYMALRFIIKLSEEEFGIFLLSLFGGYPIGAKLLADRAQPTDSASPLPFCYCPSPGFVISVAGVGLFANVQAGLIVYISNVLACVFIAILCRSGLQPARNKDNFHRPLQLNVFTPAILSASSALFPVCAVIAAFGVIKGTLQFIGIENDFVFAVLEITGTSQLAPNPALLPLIAALFSTGGLCIIMQIPALTKKKLPLREFYLWRIPAAVLSALFCKLLMPLVDFTAYVPASTGGVAALPTEAGSPVASVCLLIMAVILVKTAGEEQVDT